MKTMKSLYVLAGRLPRPMLTLALGLVFLADALGQLAVPYTASGTYQVPTGVSQALWSAGVEAGEGGRDLLVLGLMAAAAAVPMHEAPWPLLQEPTR